MTREVIEQPLVFECEGEQCLGILARSPMEPPGDVAMIIVVGGPQYRVGSHRQFVLLSRALAARGVPVLRFDYRGMGDSAGPMRTFERVEHDLRAAVDQVCQIVGAKHVVLWGLCDGASAAMMYARSDPRIAGLVAVNPWVRSEQGLATARIKHYYLDRLMSRELWSKLLRGELQFGKSLRDALHSLKLSLGAKLSKPSTSSPSSQEKSFLDRMHQQWLEFAKPTLILLSGNDLTAREFSDWVNADRQRTLRMRRDDVEVSWLADADHTFSHPSWMDWTIAQTHSWMSQLPIRQ